MGAEARLAELGIVLPAAGTPVANFVMCKRAGDLLYVSGHGPRTPEGTITGKVGSTLTLEQGREAARITTLNILASVRAELGSLDRVVEVVKVLGMVNTAPGFNRTPEVINGCSDLLIELFGEAGRHARSAVGMAELPFDIAVEIEMVLQVE